MNAYLKLIGCGCIALFSLACGSKGSDGDDEGDDMTGGTSGTGATGGTGGSGGSAGSASGSGGSAGSGGPLPPTTTMAFDMATEVCAVGSGAAVPDCWKLVDSNAMVVADAIPDEDITYEHTTDDGDPDPGAFQADIPYSLPSQWVSFGINFTTHDLTNRIIKARVKVTGLGDTSDPSIPAGGTKIYAKSGMTYCYANGAYTNLGDQMHPLDTWQEVQFNLTRMPDFVASDCTEPFDPADIREIGIQFDSGSTSTTVMPAVVLIDTITF